MSFIENLNHEVCRSLWDMAAEDEGMKAPASRRPNLIWPLYRDSKKGNGNHPRISEQEARFAMAIILSNDHSRHFSVETPTRETYQFKGEKPISAQTDLTIFRADGNGLERDINVEFKSHLPVQGSVDKDIEKLLREPYGGNWFHVLKNTNRGTLPALFKKMRAAAAAAAEVGPGPAELPIHFCFCCVGKRWACFRSVSKTDLVYPGSDVFDPEGIEQGKWTIWQPE